MKFDIKIRVLKTNLYTVEADSKIEAELKALNTSHKRGKKCIELERNVALGEN